MDKVRFLYLDASSIVGMILESEGRQVSLRELMAEYRGAQVLTSELSSVEVQSALCFAARDNLIELAQLENKYLSTSADFIFSPIDSTALGVAWSLVRRYRRIAGLRSLDAIHVATAALSAQASSAGHSGKVLFITADRSQHKAALMEGLQTRLVA